MAERIMGKPSMIVESGGVSERDRPSFTFIGAKEPSRQIQRIADRASSSPRRSAASLVLAQAAGHPGARHDLRQGRRRGLCRIAENLCVEYELDELAERSRATRRCLASRRPSKRDSYRSELRAGFASISLVAKSWEKPSVERQPGRKVQCRRH